MREEFLNKIKNEESINEQIFREYFNEDNQKEDNQSKNDTIVKYLNEPLIDLRNSINSKEIPENENPKKVVNIVEKILDFNKQR